MSSSYFRSGGFSGFSSSSINLHGDMIELQAKSHQPGNTKTVFRTKMNELHKSFGKKVCGQNVCQDKKYSIFFFKEWVRRRSAAGFLVLFESLLERIPPTSYPAERGFTR